MAAENGCVLHPLDESVAKDFAGRLGDPLVAQAREDMREAAVALILGQGPAEDSTRVLLMQRSEHPEDHWSGHVSFPGGHSEPEDASLVRTAMREAREEVGVALGTAGTVLGVLPEIRARGRGRLLPMRVTPIVFALRRRVRAVPGPEAQDVFALPLGPALRGELDTSFQPPPRERTRGPHPGYRWNGHTIWGMTHRMIEALLERIGDGLLKPPS